MLLGMRLEENGMVMPLWFAVRTHYRAEKVVASQLERKDIEVFLPTMTRWSRWKDRKRAIMWPLFPGYCLARFEPASQLNVLKCAGVAGIVSFAGELARIPESEVESLRTLVMSHLRYDPAPLIREGMQVRVVSGPLAGVVGRLIRKGGNARLFLSVDLLQQGVSLEVDAADVRPY
jgi:transcriptional antiterminator NusG